MQITGAIRCLSIQFYLCTACKSTAQPQTWVEQNVCEKQEYGNVWSLTNFFFCILCLQIITVKDPKRRLSLSSEDSEAEEPEYQKEVDNDLPVLDDHSQLLDDDHLKRVSITAACQK